MEHLIPENSYQYSMFFFLWSSLSKVQIIENLQRKLLDLFLKRNLVDVPFSLIFTRIINGASLVISRKGKLETTKGDLTNLDVAL